MCTHNFQQVAGMCKGQQTGGSDTGTCKIGVFAEGRSQCHYQRLGYKQMQTTDAGTHPYFTAKNNVKKAHKANFLAAISC